MEPRWVTAALGWLLRERRRHRRTDGSGEDVARDPALASSRATGGDHPELSGDRGSTTGTGRTGGFVGRIAGDDNGYAGETGAERRAEVSDADTQWHHNGPQRANPSAGEQ